MKTTRLNRRQFLATVGIGGAAVAAAVATRQASERPQDKPASSRQGKGYQVTEHVRRYYETTKV